MNDLIDTTEMYLRTIFELEEEGIAPLRARIAERLGQSGPTVSQTVARMERDGLVVVTDDRHLEMTAEGRARATSVMRKHRLAERLLLDVIGLDWADVHVEACRWEHVMSDEVEERLIALLDNPSTSPYGNPIPGLADPTMTSSTADTPADKAAKGGGAFRLVRLIEVVQNDPEVMGALHAAGAVTGATVTLRADGDRVEITGPSGQATVHAEVAAGISVTAV